MTFLINKVPYRHYPFPYLATCSSLSNWLPFSTATTQESAVSLLLCSQGLCPTSSNVFLFIRLSVLRLLSLRPCPTSPLSCCTKRTPEIERVVNFHKHCKRQGISNKTNKKATKAYIIIFTKLLNHPEMPQPLNSLSNQSQVSLC